MFEKVPLQLLTGAASLPKLPQDERKARLLNLLRAGQDLEDILIKMDISEEALAVYREEDEVFSTEVDIAFREGSTFALERLAMHRARAGSDVMIMFLLKARNRKIYDDTVARAFVAKTGLRIKLVDVSNKRSA